jgi:hypothetical protein
MSPEQWRVEPLTPAADQYALGVVAYHVLSGALPFDGTHYEIQEHHLRSDPPSLDARRAEVPPALSTVVRRMLGKRVDQRFADLRSVSQALAAISRDPIPLLRERLSRLIPTAIPGTRDAAATGGTGGDAPASFLRPTPYTPGSSLPPVLSSSPSTPWQPAAGPYTPYPGPPPGGRGGAPVPPVTAPAPGAPAGTPAAAPAGVSDAAIPIPAPAHLAAAAELTPTDGGAPAAAAGLARPAAAPPAVYTPSAPAPLDGADAPTTPAPLAPAPAERPAAAAAAPPAEAPLAQPSLAPTLAATLPPSPAPALSATAMFGAPPAGVADVPTRTPDRPPVDRPASLAPARGADAAPPAGAVAAEGARPPHGVGVDALDDAALPTGGGGDAPVRPRRRPVGAALAIGGLAVAAAVFAATREGDRESGPAGRDSAAVATRPTDSQPTVPRPPATGATATPAVPDATQPLTLDSAAAPPPPPVVELPPSPPPPPPTAAALAEARVAASVVIVGQRSNARLTLAQGDSMLLVSRVFNAAGARLRQADVQWSSSDAARAVRRNGWLVALAAGGPPVTVTATSGRASNSVQVAVTPRGPGSNTASGGQPSATIPPPTDAEVRAAADEFLAALRARNFDELSRRLTARAGDGTPTSEFLDWVRSARNFGVREGRPGGVGGDGSVRSFAIGVELRHARGGLFRSSGYADAVFNIGLRHGAGGWRASSVQLARRVAP